MGLTATIELDFFVPLPDDFAEFTGGGAIKSFMAPTLPGYFERLHYEIVMFNTITRKL
jgi:hypothetical protein